MSATGAPTGTNWGRFGPDDERGMLNLLTPEVVHGATRVPKTGEVYSLALPIQRAGRQPNLRAVSASSPHIYANDIAPSDHWPVHAVYEVIEPAADGNG